MPVNSVDALKSRFTSVLSDRTVSLAEAQELIDLVKDGGGVTQSERRQLREQFITSTDLFEGPAKDRMNKFINDEVNALLIDDAVVTITDVTDRRDLPDPAVMKDDGRLVYEWTAGQLFVNGISDDDVMQGHIGNCYFPAAVAAVARQDPKIIEDAIKDNGDGTYTVRFFDVDWDGTVTEHKIEIDGQLPTQWGGLRYGHGRDRTELWVPLLEKAYAQWKGGYEQIGNGGFAGDVLEALTGRDSDYEDVSPSSNTDALYQNIKIALETKKALAATTHDKSKAAMYSGTGIYAWHVYSVIGVSEENGTKYIHLRNPWGEVEPAGNGPDDGHFKIDFAAFQKLYSAVHVA
jgi:hypothetical protein